MKAVIAFIPGVLGAIVGFVVFKLVQAMALNLFLQFLIFFVAYLIIAVAANRAMKSYR